MFQNDLFEAAPLALVDDMEGGIRYLPDVIPAATAHAWFEQLMRHVQWNNQRRMMYDREVDVPRLMATYSLDVDPVPQPLKEAAAQLSAVTGATFNSVGLNLYRNGDDSVAPFGGAAFHDTGVWARAESDSVRHVVNMASAT